MDTISPDHIETGLSETFIKVSLNAIRTAIPSDATDNEVSREEKYQAGAELFHALKPRNPDEAALATRYVISHLRSLHLSVRAAAPELTNDQVVRLSAAAATADRLAITMRRAIGDAQKPASAPGRSPAASSHPAPWHNPQSAIAPDDMGPFDDPTLGPLPAGADGWVRLAPGARPVPHYSRFQPRDCHGEPIPFNRSDLMTMAQRRATYAKVRDPKLEAIAIAEEEEMIAGQAAKQADTAAQSAAGAV